MKKLKLDQHVKYNGQKCIVFSIRPNSDEVVLFNLGSRNYMTVNIKDIEV